MILFRVHSVGFWRCIDWAWRVTIISFSALLVAAIVGNILGIAGREELFHSLVEPLLLVAGYVLLAMYPVTWLLATWYFWLRGKDSISYADISLMLFAIGIPYVALYRLRRIGRECRLEET